ncbi:MAG: cation:proton antiporter [DPANN group archaeon]|nr:cation:proton antiporter [DPANN group archaeon]
MIDNLLFDIAFAIISGTMIAYIMKMFKQPLILGYIIAGMIIGPLGFGWIANSDTVMLLSELGVAFLLFIIGMELDFRRLANVGAFVTYGGLFQIITTFMFAYFMSLLLGFSAVTSLYMGLILTFSSTMIVIKLLSDNGKIDTLPGRMMLGILIIQDIVVILALSIVVSMTAGGDISSLVFTLFNGFGLVTLALIFKKFISPYILKFASSSPELLFMTAVSVCFTFVGAASYIGFPIAIGAFLAGISLTAYPYDLEIAGRVSSLRDFFATLFFVSLGLQIVSFNFVEYLAPLIMFTAFVLFIKPLIVLIIGKAFGYELRTAFLAALGLAQISEFSLIIVTIGVTSGLIPLEIFSITAILAIITMASTGYYIKYSDKIFDLFSHYLLIFEFFDRFSKNKNLDKEQKVVHHRNHIVLVGCHLLGDGILTELKKMKRHVIVLDYNPEIIKRLLEDEMVAYYGDVRHREVLEKLDIEHASLVISTIPDREDNMFLLNEVKIRNPKCIVFVTANNIEDALVSYDNGVDYVILPKLLGSERVNEHIDDILTNPDGIQRYIARLRRKYILTLETQLERKILNEYEPRYLKHLQKKFNFGILNNADRG